MSQSWLNWPDDGPTGRRKDKAEFIGLSGRAGGLIKINLFAQTFLFTLLRLNNIEHIKLTLSYYFCDKLSAASFSVSMFWESS